MRQRRENTNRQIVDYVLHMEPTIFGHESDVLEKTAYTFAQLRSFYSAPVKQADDIILHLQEAKERCKSLETNKQLIQELQHHLRLMSMESDNPVAFYKNHRKRIKRMESMAFLFCSDNELVRDLYVRIRERCSNIYNGYMSEARG